MNNKSLIIMLAIFLTTACTSQKKLAYLNNLPGEGGEQYFPMDAPDYKIQPRDVLYITLKAMNPEGLITDFLSGTGSASTTTYMQSEGGGYLYGYNVNSEGIITLPVIGPQQVDGLNLEEIREKLQLEFNRNFRNAVVECKLLSFKFTVIGEVKTPGTYMNYNNYLTIFEAIGRAGGIGDFGKRDKILVIRPAEKGTKTFKLDLQDKDILTSEAYFLLPNDVVIVEPQPTKIFNLNLPLISFAVTSITGIVTSTLLFIDYFK